MNMMKRRSRQNMKSTSSLFSEFRCAFVKTDPSAGYIFYIDDIFVKLNFKINNKCSAYPKKSASVLAT